MMSLEAFSPSIAWSI